MPVDWYNYIFLLSKNNNVLHNLNFAKDHTAINNTQFNRENLVLDLNVFVQICRYHTIIKTCNQNSISKLNSLILIATFQN